MSTGWKGLISSADGEVSKEDAKVNPRLHNPTTTTANNKPPESPANSNPRLHNTATTRAAGEAASIGEAKNPGWEGMNTCCLQ